MKSRRWLRWLAVGGAPLFFALVVTLPEIKAIRGFQVLLWLVVWIAPGFLAMRLLPTQPEAKIKRLLVLLLAASGIVALFVAQVSAAYLAMYFFSENGGGDFLWFDEYMRQFTAPMLLGWFLGPVCMVAATVLCGKARLVRLLAVLGYWFAFIPPVWLAIWFWMLLGAERIPKGLLTFRF